MLEFSKEYLAGRKQAVNRPIIIFASVFVGLIAIILLAWLWFNRGLSAVTSSDEAEEFTVQDGDSVKAIAQRLADQNLIRNPLAFRIYVLLEGLSANLQAGQFAISPSQDARSIARQLAGGEGLTRELTVVIPEGLTNVELADRLAEKFLSAAQLRDSAVTTTQLAGQFLTAFSVTDSRQIVPDQNYNFLRTKPSDQSLEGYLFPDTYRFYRDAQPAEIVERLLDNFDQRVPESIRNQASLIGRSFYDVLIMASILERELKTKTDRQLAADLFWRRLDAGIALQSDATVNYLTGKKALQPTNADLSVDSPYNTYQQPGLPPGPINNPGLESIKAALTPTPNDFWYFLTDSKGQTHFAKTLAEHNANKAKYLQ